MKRLANFLRFQTVRYGYWQFGASWKKPKTFMVFGNPLFKRFQFVYTSIGSDVRCTRFMLPHVSLDG